MSVQSRRAQHIRIAVAQGAIWPTEKEIAKAHSQLSDAYWRKRREDWKYAKGPVYIAR